MKQEMDNFSYVDAYLEGSLNRDEMRHFERELETNNTMKAEHNIQSKINTMLEEQDVLDLQQQLNSIYEKQYQPIYKSLKATRATRKVLFRAGSMAAAAVIIISSIFFILKQQSTAPATLFNEYYEPAEISMNFRAAADQIDADLRSAMLLYEQKEYEEAIVLFERILKDDQSRIGLNLYSGISNMEIQEYEKANENFQKIIDHKANAFVESAEWYLALCHLRVGNDDKARDIFNGIINRDGYFRNDAKKILRRLK